MFYTCDVKKARELENSIVFEKKQCYKNSVLLLASDKILRKEYYYAQGYVVFGVGETKIPTDHGFLIPRIANKIDCIIDVTLALLNTDEELKKNHYYVSSLYTLKDIPKFRGSYHLPVIDKSEMAFQAMKSAYIDAFGEEINIIFERR